MKCKEVTDLMHRQLDGDLTSEEEELLFVHLSSCTDCQAKFEQLKQLSLNLESLPKVELPYSIVDQILPQLESMELEKEGVSGKFLFPWKNVLKKRVWIPGLAMVAGLFITLIVLSDDGLPPVQENSLSSSTEQGVAMNKVAEDTIDQAESFSIESAEQDFSGILKEEEFSEEQDEFSVAQHEEPSSPVGEEESSESSIQNEPREETEEAALAQAEDDPPMEVARFATVEDEKIPSPDGLFTAYLGLEKEEIFIDKQEEAHYISKNSWKAPWVVEQMEWVEPTKLYYVLYQPEIDERQYWLINLDDRSEVQLEEAYEEQNG